MIASRGQGWTLTWSRKGLEALRSLDAQTWENGQCNAGPSAEAKGTLESGDSEDVRVTALLVAQRRRVGSTCWESIGESPFTSQAGAAVIMIDS